MTKEILVNYNVVSEIAGHQSNKDVKLVEAALDIFKHCKEKAMQCAVDGKFIVFDTIEELTKTLKTAVHHNYSINVYDENIGG